MYIDVMFRNFGQRFIYCVKRLYVNFWHELSLDERVRASPYVPPPENEVKMSFSAISFYRLNRILILYIHICAILSVLLCIRGYVKIQTIIFTLFLLLPMLFGIICGAHRLWTHKAYQANWQLRLFLMICQTMSSQYNIYNWVRDHRLHHKCSDTRLDPHDSTRGFFFSHCGWLLIQRTPEAKRELKKIYMEDIKEDKIVMFQYRYYAVMLTLLGYLLPNIIPWYLWNESFLISHLTAVQLRIALMLNMTFTVNSFAHMWGQKPFDKRTKATDSRLVCMASLGSEGWHNYHHVFPWDYKPSEFLGYDSCISTLFIEFCAQMGWAYNLKTTSPELIIKRRKRTGDLSYRIWGWDDPSISPEDMALTKVSNNKYEDTS